MMNDNIDEMLDKASESVEETNIKKNNKITILFISIAIIFAVIITFMFMLIKYKKSINTEESLKETTNVDNTQETDKSEDAILKEIEVFLENNYPVVFPKWLKQPFNLSSLIEKDEIYEHLLQFAENQDSLSKVIFSFPSGKADDYEYAPPAYTNDVSLKFIDDFLNNEFSYTLKEDYLVAYANYIFRLLNPEFGEWYTQQIPYPGKNIKADNGFKILKSMFHPDWWNKNIIENEDYSKLPILADWNSDNFMNTKLAEISKERTGTWYGVVDEEKTVEAYFVGRDDTEYHSQIIEIFTPVKYYAFGINKVISHEGTIKMTLGANPIDYMPNRVVILDVELILK